MRKVINRPVVTCRGQSRLIVAIDYEAGQVELAPLTNVRDAAAGAEPGGAGLQYIGGASVPGEIVSVAECEPRPDHSPGWPWPTI